MNTKKLIGISMIALLVVVMGAGMAAAVTPDIDATDAAGIAKQKFSTGEHVYARGIGLTGSPADVYIVVDPAHKIWVNGETIDDPTNHSMVLSVTAYPAEIDELNISYVLPPKLLGTVGNNPGEIPEPGCYDVVYDCNRDGIYNMSDGDCVDYVECCGFSTVPEFTTIAIPAIALLGLVLYMRRKKD